MPSRKRSKAKERKAKKTETRLSRTIQSWQDWSLWGIENPKIQCNHGCNTNIPQRDHPVYKFVDSFIEAATSKSVSLTVSLQTLLTTMPQVWKEKTLRNEIVRIFISIATNQMMHEYQYGSLLSQFSTNSLSQIIPFARAIILIENQDLIQDDDILTIFYHPKITAKYKNFNDDPNASGRRDILKFLSRRISCSCLKDVHRQARLTITKTRRCEYCMEFKERDELMLCGGCRLLECCSMNAKQPIGNGTILKVVLNWPIINTNIKSVDQFGGKV